MEKYARRGLFVIIIFMFLVLLLFSVSFVSSDDSKEGDDKNQPVLFKRTASSDTYRNPDGTYSTTLYSNAVNRDDKSRRFPVYVPIEDTINLTESKIGELKITDLVTGKECYIEMDYVKSGFSLSQPKTNIVKNRGYWYFTTDARTGVNSMAYKLNCSDYNISFSDEALNLGSEIKIDFKQARTEQNISTIMKETIVQKERIEDNEIVYYNETEYKLEFSVIKGKAGDLRMIDPTITLQDADTENLDDSYVEEGQQSYTHGSALDLEIQDYVAKDKNILIKFNLSELSIAHTILSANLNLFIRFNGLDDSSEGYNISIHRVNANYTWSEETLNWTLLPQSGEFNASIEDTYKFYGGAGEPDDMWVSWNVTNYMNVFSNYNNITFYLKPHDSFGSPSALDKVTFDSKEYGTTSSRPILNITYTPYMDIITPSEGQIFTEDQPTAYFNISTEVNMTDCYWSPDTGITNYTMTEVNTTWFTLANTTMVDGSYTIVYYCNQSDDGTWRTSETVSFDVDSVNVTTCRDLAVSDRTYLLKNAISGSTTSNCINIKNVSIIFDGQAYNIDSDGTASFGIYSHWGSAKDANITIKNCNLTDWDIYGISLYHADNTTIKNTSIMSGTDGGIIVNSDDINITDTTITMTGESSSNYGIYNGVSSPPERFYIDRVIIDGNYSYSLLIDRTVEDDDTKTKIYNTNITSPTSYGIHLDDSGGIEINNIYINTSNNLGSGILLDSADYVNISNSRIITPKGQGMNIVSSDFFQISNTIVENASFAGIYINAAGENSIINNTNITSTGWDIRFINTLDADCSLILEEVYGTDNKPIFFHGNSAITLNNWNNNVSELILCHADNSVIDNLTMLEGGLKNNGLFIIRSSNINISDSNITGKENGVRFFYGDNIIVSDTVIGDSNEGDVYSFGDDDIILLNSTYSNETIVTPLGKLHRKWYFETEVNATSTGTYLQNANVTAYNITNDIDYSELTNASGNIGKESLTEYINVGGTKTYYTPHNITTSKPGYTTNTTTYNLTIEQNLFHYVSLLGGYNRTITNSLTFSGIIGRRIALTKSISQIFNLNTLTNRIANILRGVSNSLNIDFVVNRIIGFSIDITESISINSLTERIRGFFRAIFAFFGITFFPTPTYADNTNPHVNITAPLNGSVQDHNVNLDLEYTASDNIGLQTCRYTTDEGITNTTITCGTNTTVTGVQGENNWTMWVSDTSGNWNSSSIFFTINGLTLTPQSWIYYAPKLNFQTRWFNSLLVTSKLNYDYNAHLNITTDTLSVSQRVQNESGTTLSHYFDVADGVVNWTGLARGYVIGTSETTYFDIYYNTSKVTMNSTNYTLTELGQTYLMYNLTVKANSTRNMTDVYVYYNFSDTNIVNSILYNCTNGSLECTNDISDRADVSWGDGDGDGIYDYVEWFVNGINSNNRSYQLRNAVGSTVEVTQDIEILNPPIKVFSNIDWENTITLYNPNSFASAKVLKIELPFGSRDITLDGISKNLLYDPTGILSPYILIIDKNDPSHKTSVYLSPGETKTASLKYTTDSVTVHSSTYFPSEYEVSEMAKIVYVLRIKNQADDDVTDLEYRIPIDYAEDLIVCKTERTNGCIEDDDDPRYTNLTIDTQEEVEGDYKLEVGEINASEVVYRTLSFYIPTVEVVNTEKGRRSVVGNLTNFKKIEFKSIAPYKLSNVVYKDAEINCNNIIKVVSCDFYGICSTPLKFTCPTKISLGAFPVNEEETIYIWHTEERVDLEEETWFTGLFDKVWSSGKIIEVEKGSVLYYIIGFLGKESLTEEGIVEVYLNRVIIVGSGIGLILFLIIYFAWRRRRRRKLATQE